MYLSIHPSIYLSVYPSIYLFIILIPTSYDMIWWTYSTEAQCKPPNRKPIKPKERFTHRMLNSNKYDILQSDRSVYYIPRSYPTIWYFSNSPISNYFFFMIILIYPSILFEYLKYDITGTIRVVETDQSAQREDPPPRSSICIFQEEMRRLRLWYGYFRFNQRCGKEPNPCIYRRCD